MISTLHIFLEERINQRARVFQRPLYLIAFVLLLVPGGMVCMTIGPAQVHQGRGLNIENLRYRCLAEIVRRFCELIGLQFFGADNVVIAFLHPGLNEIFLACPDTVNSARQRIAEGLNRCLSDL